MNLIQAFKMAWKSICGKKGRSALTILGIFIGIAAVMTIVSVLEGMKEFTREQYAAMGSNRITVSIWSNSYDEEGNSLAPDYFPDLYDYCNGLREYVDGVTPNGRANATVVYGTKSSANMQYDWDEEEYHRRYAAGSVLRQRPVQRVQQSDSGEGPGPGLSGHEEL